jgi:hypothetical protein
MLLIEPSTNGPFSMAMLTNQRFFWVFGKIPWDLQRTFLKKPEAKWKH